MATFGTEEEIYIGYNQWNQSGFNGKYGDGGYNNQGSTLPDSKYYDVYLTNNIRTACNGECYGQALSETENWYGNSTGLGSKTAPWLIRGGTDYWDTSGIYHVDYYHGDVGFSTRVVFSLK